MPASMADWALARVVLKAKKAFLKGKKPEEKIWPYIDLKTTQRMEESKRRIVIGGTDLRSGDWYTWAKTKPVPRLHGSRPGEASLFSRRDDPRPAPKLADKKGKRRWFNALDAGNKRDLRSEAAAQVEAAPRIAEPLKPASTKLRSGVAVAARKRALENSGALARRVSEQRNSAHSSLPTGMSRVRTDADELWHRSHRDVTWHQLSLHRKARVAERLDSSFLWRAAHPEQDREHYWLSMREFVGERLEEAVETRLHPPRSTDPGRPREFSDDAEAAPAAPAPVAAPELGRASPREDLDAIHERSDESSGDDAPSALSADARAKMLALRGDDASG